MDISAGSVPPKFHRRNGSWDKHKHLDRIYEKPVFQGERMLDSYKMVISGMKQYFTLRICPDYKKERKYFLQ